MTSLNYELGELGLLLTSSDGEHVGDILTISERGRATEYVIDIIPRQGRGWRSRSYRSLEAAKYRALSEYIEMVDKEVGQ